MSRQMKRVGAIAFTSDVGKGCTEALQAAGANDLEISAIRTGRQRSKGLGTRKPTFNIILEMAREGL